MENMNKYGSRKFLVLFFSSMLLVFLPILYSQYKISDDILKIVLYAVSGLAGTYTGFNVLSKKVEWLEFLIVIFLVGIGFLTAWLIYERHVLKKYQIDRVRSEVDKEYEHLDIDELIRRNNKRFGGHKDSKDWGGSVWWCFSAIW